MQSRQPIEREFKNTEGCFYIHCMIADKDNKPIPLSEGIENHLKDLDTSMIERSISMQKVLDVAFNRDDALQLGKRWTPSPYKSCVMEVIDFPIDITSLSPSHQKNTIKRMIKVEHIYKIYPSTGCSSTEKKLYKNGILNPDFPFQQQKAFIAGKIKKSDNDISRFYNNEICDSRPLTRLIFSFLHKLPEKVKTMPEDTSDKCFSNTL